MDQQIILKSVYTVFDNATFNVENVLTPFVKLNYSPFDPEGVPARERLLSRSIKLLENMLRWRGYAGDKHAFGELCVRLVNNCILGIAESGWEVGGEQKMREVLFTFFLHRVPRDLTTLAVGGYHPAT